MKIILSLILILLIVVQQSQQKIQCLNADGNAVDWWIAMKLPVAFNSGYDYMYFDTNSDSLTHLSGLPNSNSPLFRTLAQIADETTGDTTSVFWNDQPPNQSLPSYSYAHQKGFLGFDMDGNGFIMVHSSPNFVSVIDKKVQLVYPSTSLRYGQHFMCITINDISTYDLYAQLLLVDRPYVYNSSIPSSIQSKVPNLVLLLDNSQRSADLTKIATFKSAGGVTFTKFAKSGNQNANFYNTLVAPYYKANMAIETWGNSAAGLQSADCDTYHVVSNLQVTYSSDYSYSYLQDHCKYGVSMSGDQPVVCYGDINRQKSQFTRGGGTVCFLHEKLHSLVKASFASQQTCSSSVSQFLREIIH